MITRITLRGTEAYIGAVPEEPHGNFVRGFQYKYRRRRFFSN
jgi:hypothetical protein